MFACACLTWIPANVQLTACSLEEGLLQSAQSAQRAVLLARFVPDLGCGGIALHQRGLEPQRLPCLGVSDLAESNSKKGLQQQAHTAGHKQLAPCPKRPRGATTEGDEGGPLCRHVHEEDWHKSLAGLAPASRNQIAYPTWHALIVRRWCRRGRRHFWRRHSWRWWQGPHERSTPSCCTP